MELKNVWMLEAASLNFSHWSYNLSTCELQAQISNEIIEIQIEAFNLDRLW